MQQHAAGQHEAQQHRHAHAAIATSGAPAGQRRAAGRLAPQAAAVEARRAARLPLQRQQQHDEAEQAHRQLRRRHPVAEREPRAVDAGGEGLHREVRHRAVVGQRLHQRQRDAGGDRRPRHRQRHAQEAAPRRQPERAAGLDDRAAALHEGRARQHEHVRVQHEREHHHRAAQCAHVGEPVIGARPAHRRAQPALHRAGELQHVGVGVGHHVGRHRQRQHQRPFEGAAQREIEMRDQPRSAHADDRSADPDPEAQPQRGRDVFRQHRRGQVRPGAAGAGREHIGADRDDRQRDEQRHHQRRHAEPADAWPARTGA